MSDLIEDGEHLSLSGVERIAAERWRQKEIEGYSLEHDQGHENALVRAALAYATPPFHREMIRLPDGRLVPQGWPWGPDDWKPTPLDRERELEKAGALLAAEIDRRMGAR